MIKDNFIKMLHRNYHCPKCGALYHDSFFLHDSCYYETTEWSDGSTGSYVNSTDHYINYCNKCNSYYILTRQEVQNEEEPKGDRIINIDYEGLKSAITQFEIEGFLDSEEEYRIRHYYFLDFNCRYYKKNNVPPEEEAIFFRNNLSHLINATCQESERFKILGNRSDDEWASTRGHRLSLLYKCNMGEFLRELGHFDKAKCILNEALADQYISEKMSFKIHLILEKIENKDSRLFIIGK